MIIERDLPVKMDDGVVLRADVYRPDTKRKCPLSWLAGHMEKGLNIRNTTSHCGNPS